MRLSEFWDQLEKHDWYYTFSDDERAYRNGEKGRLRLEGIAKQSPEHQALLDGFTKHFFSGEPFGTPKVPLPERPGVRAHATK